MSNTSPPRARGATHCQNGKPVSVDLDSLPVTITDIERAAELLEGVIERTPVAHSRALSPVSYTHLDVYKRQTRLTGAAVRRRSEGRPRGIALFAGWGSG